MNTQTSTHLFAKRVENVPQSFIREILKVAGRPGIVSFAGGLPNPKFFPVKELEECAGKVLKEHGMQALQYASTEGYFPLREYLCKRYYTRFGLNITPEQILITNGSQQALDLVSKLFIEPGDKLVLERPSYLGALQCFSVFQPNFKEVDLEDDGPNIGQLEAALKKYDVKLFYSIPNFQNPTGISYSKEKRRQLAQTMGNSDAILIEDDPYGEINFSGKNLPPVYSFIPEQTILLGSFSKIVAPGLRLGWMVAEPEIIRKATVMKQASDLHSNNLTQYILHEFISKYNLDEHIARIRSQYKFQSEVMVDCLKTCFSPSVKFTLPQGGMFTWLTLPAGITARQLLQESLKENIIFVPGDCFYASNPNTQTLRLNFSNVEEGAMRKAMKKLGEILSGLVDMR